MTKVEAIKLVYRQGRPHAWQVFRVLVCDPHDPEPIFPPHDKMRQYYKCSKCSNLTT